MQNYAKTKGGKCLSAEYVNNHEKLLWECEKRHRWYAKWIDIHNDHWCPVCNTHKRVSQETINELVRNRKGKLISKYHKDKKLILRLECDNGHHWTASWNSIHRGTWCRYCSQGTSQRLTKNYFEHFTGQKFITSRPEWLKNKKGKRLELDGYAKNISVAFEYQGEQHYKYLPHVTHGTPLEKVQEHDQIKRELCAKKGIILIEIPYNISSDMLGAYILGQCKERNILIIHDDIPALEQLRVSIPSNLELCRYFARTKGGKCLSEVYLNFLHKMFWECDKGHRWYATWKSVYRGTWCPVCAKNIRPEKRRRYTIEMLREYAKQKGGNCLSGDYRNTKQKFLWKCSVGHRWMTTWNSVRDSHTWCPECSGKKKHSIDDMRALAKTHEGYCLSKTYINSRTKLRWRCKKGHEWMTEPGIVLQGHWCRMCGYKESARKKAI